MLKEDIGCLVLKENKQLPLLGVQETINQMVKKGLKEEVDALVVEVFYTSAIPFNVIRISEFAKMCEMIGKYGVGYKPPSYQDIKRNS